MANVRHYSSPIVLCPPADGQGAVEGGGMVSRALDRIMEPEPNNDAQYNQEDVSDARDYPHQHGQFMDDRFYCYI